MASEVERVALQFEGVELTKAEGKPNPITGEHVELTVQPVPNYDVDKTQLKVFLNEILPKHMLPKRIKISSVAVGHRYKRS
jgi:acyl-CoA synthetase (AMP-forming)/AMP-acid ligase II